MYIFRPRKNATPQQNTFLSKNGICNLPLGNIGIDPKYSGPCGPQYLQYKNCLLKTEFNRNQCRDIQNMVTNCQNTKLSNEQQLKILKNWKKNRGKSVKRSHIPIQIYNEQPVKLS